MTTSRVSTFGLSSSILQNALKTQAKLAEKQVQESSGLISSDYAGLGSDASTAVNVQTSIDRANATIDAAETTDDRLEEMYAALGDMSDYLTSARSALSEYSSTGDIDTFQTEIQSLLEQLVSSVNTQYNGRYLFAGSDTETEPVSIDDYEATDLTTEDTSYYSGDSEILTARLSSTQTISYGITGDDSGIEEAIRALSYLANVDEDDLDSDAQEAASDLLISAQDQIIALQSETSYKATTVESIIDQEEDYVSTASEISSDLTSVDIASAAAEASSYEAQLEASYSALGTLSSLSLVDYL